MSEYMGRTLEQAIQAAAKLKEELPHIAQVYPSDYDKIIMAAEIERLRAVLDNATHEAKAMVTEIAQLKGKTLSQMSAETLRAALGDTQ